jgi:DNA-binding FadR family transcriptional regulator
MTMGPLGSAHTRGLGGRTQVRGILGSVLDDLGRRIVGGEWMSGEAVPIENEMILQYGFSRSVIREAIRMLNAKGLVRSRQMAGTKVLPRAEWRHLDPDVIGWRIKAGDRKMLLDDLLHVRLVLEPSVARYAAMHASPEKRADLYPVSTSETDQLISAREVFWSIVTPRSDDETEADDACQFGGRGDQGHPAGHAAALVG